MNFFRYVVTLCISFLGVLFLFVPSPALAQAKGGFIDSLDSVVKMSEKELLAKYGDRLSQFERKPYIKGYKTWVFRPDESFLKHSIKPYVVITTMDGRVEDVSFYWFNRLAPRDGAEQLKSFMTGLSDRSLNIVSDGVHAGASKVEAVRKTTLIKGATDAERWALLKTNILDLHSLNKLGVRALLGDAMGAVGTNWYYQITPIYLSKDKQRRFGDSVELSFIYEEFNVIRVYHEDFAAK